MDITKKIDVLLNENTLPSQGLLRKEMSKGLSKNVNDIAWTVAMSLWHYFDPKIVRGPGVIFKTQSSNKIADELWYRIGRSIEDSEMLDDSGIKKLKRNFYHIMGKWGNLYSITKKGTGWEFIS
jgi:hypothetical protein